MTVTWLAQGDLVPAARGEAIVTIPVYGGHEQFVACLRSVLQHTPAEVSILVCDDASPDKRSADFVAEVEQLEPEHRLFYIRQERNLGFPGNLNVAFAMTAPADVVILNSDCVVGAHWMEGLRDAAYCDHRVATATALTNNGTIVSVPDRNRPRATLPPGWSVERAAEAIRHDSLRLRPRLPTALTNNGTIVSVPDRNRPRATLPQGWSVERAAEAIRHDSLRLRPRLPTAIGHCVYVRRSALELVGGFDLAFSPGYGEEVDFSQRCLRTGLTHVLADDVFVFHSGGASFSSDGQPVPVRDEHEALLASRYPYYHAAVASAEAEVTGPLARALSAARRALKGLSVLIDARVLAGPMTGTQLQVLEVIAALSQAGGVRIAVIVPDEIPSYAADALEALPGVTQRTREEVEDPAFERADLVHRPNQIDNDQDIAFLAPLGERLIVTNQDLIGYHNPTYFDTFLKWEGYRRLTRSALAVADHVVFVSAHARDDALAEDLIEPGRASVVHNGVDHLLAGSRFVPAPPRTAARIPDGAETMLCLGTDFRHKNRIFALRLLAELRARLDWKGILVMAGPKVTRGSSLREEADLLRLHPGLEEAVLDAGVVTEQEKAWLFERAQLVLYPTVHEGFGLVPFEAADHRVPCLWAPGTSLAEVLPPSAAGIEAWDVAGTARTALALMRDERSREANVSAIRAAAAGLTWAAAAAKLIQLYRATCDAPATPASGIERRNGIMQGALSQDAMRLVGPDGALPADVERPLLALATHPQIGGPMFRAMKLGYRASFALRRRGRSSQLPSGRPGGGATNGEKPR